MLQQKFEYFKKCFEGGIYLLCPVFVWCSDSRTRDAAKLRVGVIFLPSLRLAAEGRPVPKRSGSPG